jgi:hypothetical protein
VEVSPGDTADRCKPGFSSFEIIVNEVAMMAAFQNSKLKQFFVFVIKHSGFFCWLSLSIKLGSEDDSRWHIFHLLGTGFVREYQGILLDLIVVIEPELLEHFAGWTLGFLNFCPIGLILFPEHIVKHWKHGHVELKQVAFFFVGQQNSTRSRHPTTTTFSEGTDATRGYVKLFSMGDNPFNSGVGIINGSRCLMFRGESITDVDDDGIALHSVPCTDSFMLGRGSSHSTTTMEVDHARSAGILFNLASMVCHEMLRNMNQ